MLDFFKIMTMLGGGLALYLFSGTFTSPGILVAPLATTGLLAVAIPLAGYIVTANSETHRLLRKIAEDNENLETDEIPDGSI